MEEVVSLRLENEMDLLLANRRALKLAELCGLSLTLQTAFATAVSEIARTALSISTEASLRLGITAWPRKKNITAILSNTGEACGNSDAFRLAKRLAEIQLMKGAGGTCDVRIDMEIKYPALITDLKVAALIEYFKTEPPLSPYDEVKRKSIQLLEFSRKLEESEGQYRQLADTLPLMMFVANPDGQVIYTNRWLRSYLGDNLTSIAPGSIQVMTHPDDQNASRKDWYEAFSSGRHFTTEARMSSKKGGDYLWHLISVHPVLSAVGTIVQWTGFLVDINAQKTVAATLKDNADLNRAKERLVDYQRQLEEKIGELNTSNTDLAQFAFIASHDLQEPLRKIATFSGLLQQSLPSLEEVPRLYLDRIISSSVQMKDQINDVLDWSGIARSSETFIPVDLNSIIDAVKSNLEVAIAEKNAVIQISPLPVLRGSPLQLIRLFSNLVSNSLKFCTTEPVVTISSRTMTTADLELRKIDSSVNYAEISVADNGVGFKQEYAKQIFRIFQRLHGHHEYKGTGIGLAICKKITDNHRGEIYATSTPGQGATFTIILPIAHQE